MNIHQQSAKNFLSLFRSPRVIFTTFTSDYVFGHVTWEDQPKETQQIAVDLRQDPLSSDAVALLEFLKAHDFVDIDRLTVGRETLRDMFRSGNADWTSERFDSAYSELLRFRIAMMDDGKITDSFFLHE